jgi:hypothetical protein
MSCLSWLIIAFLQTAASLPPQELARDPSAPFIERSQRQFRFYPGGKVELTLGVPGDVKVVGWQRPEITVDIEKLVYRMGEEEARALASSFPVQVKYTQTEATIRIPIGKEKKDTPAFPPGLEINLTVRVPRQRTDMRLQTVKGDLSFEDINGWLEATLTEGSIETKSISGYFSGLTELGNVDADLSGPRWEGYEFAAVTHRGSVLLRLPLRFSAALQLETRDGALSIDYPEQLVDGESIPLVAVAKKRGQSLSATIGDGGAPVKLMTFLGDIRMEAKRDE